MSVIPSLKDTTFNIIFHIIKKSILIVQSTRMLSIFTNTHALSQVKVVRKEDTRIEQRKIHALNQVKVVRRLRLASGKKKQDIR